MSTTVQNLLDSFNQLSELEKWELTTELIRRTRDIDVPSLTDEELVLSAEMLFIELDQREAESETKSGGSWESYSPLNCWRLRIGCAFG